MRSPLTRAAVAIAGAATLASLLAGTASAESVYCVWVPNVTTVLGPRPASTQQALCIPWGA